MTFIKEQAEKIGAIFGLSMKSSATASWAFSMNIIREADSKGDRVKVIMSGKFLPYKTY
jgi:cyanate lyase